MNTHRRARTRVRRRAVRRARPRLKRRSRCRRRGDRLVPLKYLNGGSVWIPSEARCGGSYPVIVLLHGNNSSKETVASLGGGRRLDRWARRYLNGRLIEPVILAEPIHFGACTKGPPGKGLDWLFSGRFSFDRYRALLEKTLRRNGIRPKSWSFIGHSGAACCLSMGLFAVPKTWPRIRVWASSDGCYGGPSQAETLKTLFGTARTKVINACRGKAVYSGYRSYERTLLTRKAEPTGCDKTYYKRCRRHPTKPWYSYVTRRSGVKTHSGVLVEVFKTVVFNSYPSKRRLALRARQEARRRRLAAHRGRRARLRRERQARLRRRSGPKRARGARSSSARRPPTKGRGRSVASNE